MINTETITNSIINVKYSKDIIYSIRKRMKDNYKYLICETHPNSIYHKEYFICKDQDTVNNLIDTYDNNNLWYITDETKPIKLSIDFDYKIANENDNIEANKYFNKIKEHFKNNIEGIASRSGLKKYSKRLYTNLYLNDTISLKYYMLDFIKKNNYDKKIIDISIYSKNRLYPIVNNNIKTDRKLKWEIGGGKDHKFCNPNNISNGEKINFEIPLNIIQRKKYGDSKITKKIKDYQEKEIDTKLFLDLLKIIPYDHWNDYNEWFKLATFCKNYFDFELFNDISSCCDSYNDKEDCLKYYNNSKICIDAGYIVNIAKTYDQEEVKKIYNKNRFTKSILTEKTIGKQCAYYFGKYFRKVGKSIFYFDKNLNVWREYQKRDLLKYIDDELDQYIKPRLLDNEGNKDNKLAIRYATITSNGIHRVIEFFGEYIQILNENEFDKEHKNKLFFTNGFFNFEVNKFEYDKSPEWYNKTVINFQYNPYIDNNKKNELNNYFNQLFKTNLDDFECFKNMIGKALTANHQKNLLVLTESGNNGKSSILGLLNYSFNNYGCNMGDSELLTQPLSTSKPRVDIQNIISKRLVTMLEPDENIKLNTSAVKQVTGGDKLSARGYFQKETINFKNHALICIGANTMPPMSKVDKAIANRLICIPMKSKFLSKNEYEKYKDKENIFLGNPKYLESKFFEEYGESALQIFINWAIEYKDKDLILTDSIQEKTDEYLNDSGLIQWMEENYEETNDNSFVKLSDIFEYYNYSGNEKIGKHNFFKTIKDHPKYSMNYRKDINNKNTKNIKIRNILVNFKKIENIETDDEE